jgi:hypothetical protein
MPIEEAIHHFVEANGRWPSYEHLYEFINKLGIIVESPNRVWHELGGTAAVIAKARVYRTSLGLKSPEGTAKIGRPAGVLEIRVPEGGLPGAPTGRTGPRGPKEDQTRAA